MNEETKQACPTNDWKPTPLDVAVEEIYAITGQYSKPKEGWPEQRVKQYIRDVVTAYARAGVSSQEPPQRQDVITSAPCDGSASPRCVKWGCNQAKLEWLEKGRSLQTRHGFFTAYSDGWICPTCGGGYGGKPTPNH